MLPQSVCQRCYESPQPPPLLAELSKRVRTSVLSIKMMFGVIERVNSRNIEANPVLYTTTIFDFRSFRAYLIASTLLPAHTFSSICSIHLKHTFGEKLWLVGPDCYIKLPLTVWNQVWEIVKGMEDLKNVIVDVDAILEHGRLGREAERDLFERLGAVRLRSGGESGFVVRVTWEGDDREGAEEGLGTGTFRLVRGKVAEW